MLRSMGLDWLIEDSSRAWQVYAAESENENKVGLDLFINKHQDLAFI
jgi:hypothetical protein